LILDEFDAIEQAVIARLVSVFRHIYKYRTMNFKEVYAEALNLPNNNILNIISKAKQEVYKPLVLEFFQTRSKTEFVYDAPIINFLYMNGVVDVERVKLGENYIKFPCPFVQNRLFNYFAKELYQKMDDLYGPFEDLSDTITDKSLNIRRLLQRYEQYLQANREQVLKDAPRRKNDLRVSSGRLSISSLSLLG